MKMLRKRRRLYACSLLLGDGLTCKPIGLAFDVKFTESGMAFLFPDSHAFRVNNQI